MSRATARAARGALFAAILVTGGVASADLAPPRGLQPAPPVQARPAAAASIVAPPAASSAVVAPPAASSAAVAPPAASSAALAPPPASAAAPSPSGSTAPAPLSSAPVRDDLCPDAVVAWTKAASQRSGLTITPASCSAGIVRLAVAGAGCDFEVARNRGFQRTADGSIGVSPIADLDWKDAPEPMKKALAGILAALAQDGTLLIPAGEPVFGEPAGGAGLFSSRRNQILFGVGGLFGLAALGLWLKRRKGGPAAPPPA